MNGTVVWVFTPCSTKKTGRFGGTYSLRLKYRKPIKKQQKQNVDLSPDYTALQPKTWYSSVTDVRTPQDCNHEDIWGSGGIAPPFLTSAVDGDEWSASRQGYFTSGETAPNT
jgi:hypothetical protein